MKTKNDSLRRKSPHIDMGFDKISYKHQDGFCFSSHLIATSFTIWPIRLIANQGLHTTHFLALHRSLECTTEMKINAIKKVVKSIESTFVRKTREIRQDDKIIALSFHE